MPNAAVLSARPGEAFGLLFLLAQIRWPMDTRPREHDHESARTEELKPYRRYVNREDLAQAGRELTCGQAEDMLLYALDGRFHWDVGLQNT